MTALTTDSKRPADDESKGTVAANPLGSFGLPFEMFASAYGTFDRFARVRLPSDLTHHEVAFSFHGQGSNARLFLLKPDMGMVLVGPKEALHVATRFLVDTMGPGVAMDLNTRSFLLCHFWLKMVNEIPDANLPSKIHIRPDYDPFQGPVGLGIVRTWCRHKAPSPDGQIGYRFEGDYQFPRTSFPICLELDDASA